MRNLLSYSSLRFLLSFFSAIMLMTSCKNINEKKSTANLVQREEDPNSRLTDFLGAMEYEFNMLKNPTTGTIPEGIHEAELLQARQILTQQQINGITTLPNVYSFQGPNN